MKVLFLVLFFGIARVFSTDIDLSKISDDNLKELYDSKYSEYEPFSLNNLGIWKDGSSESDKILKFFQTLSKGAIFSSSLDLDFRESKMDESAQKKNKLTSEDVFLLEALAAYLNSRFSATRCNLVMNLICPLVDTYPNITEKIRKAVKDKCEDKNKTCNEAVKMLPEHCNNVKTHHDATNKDADKDAKQDLKTYCSIYQPKCVALKLACNGTLDQTCKTVEQKCPKEEESGKPTIISGGIMNLHTVIVDKTIYETETVVYTETKVVKKVKTCCNKKPYYTSCKPTTKPKIEHPGDEECSVTLTVTSHGETFTKTVTVTSATDGSKSDSITDKGDSTRLDGLRKVGLIYLILGITAGIWIIV